MCIGYDKKLFKSMYQARKVLKESGFKLKVSKWTTVDIDGNILNFRDYRKNEIRVLLVERITI